VGLRDFWSAMGRREPVANRSILFPSLQDLVAYSQNSPGLTFTQNPQREETVAPSFSGFAQQAYFASSPVFACILARASLFSEARFQWRQFRNGRPGPLFGTEDLAPLEEPWPNGTTGDLIVRLEQDYSLAGNFYGRRTRTGIQRMRPDWVTIVIGSNMEVDDPTAALDAEIIGYIYHPGGRNSGKGDPVALRVEEVCHFTGPTPDPTARFRGTSWLTSILMDIQADKSATTMQQRYYESGGSNLAIAVDIPDVNEFSAWVELFKAQSESPSNAFRRLFFNTGAPSVTKIGDDMVNMDVKNIQGHNETRIASAAGVPPIIVGFSEGLESATYSNYQLAMRRFADLTARPMWRMMASCFQSVLTVPPGASLWYDDRDIKALKDDITAIAETQAKVAAAAKLLADAGWEPDSIVDAIDSNDLTRLVHSGLPTVQLQKPANGQLPKEPAQLQAPRFDQKLEDVLQRASSR
jgi:portal protein